MTETEFSQELYTLYGRVTRARGCFLYTSKRVRLTDLYQQNGRAILGWDGGNAFTYLKNVLSRGQVGTFITEEQNHPCRLARAVSALTQDSRVVLAFASKVDALKAGLSLSPQNTSVYKPWSQSALPLSAADCLVITPPLPWTDTVFLLAVKKGLLPPEICPASATGTFLPGSIKLPFALESAITRAIYNLIAQLPLRQEKDWFLYDTVLTKYWERKGPYLYPKVPDEKYDDFIKHCLVAELAINPAYNEPSIVPFGADKGVFTKLKNTPFDY